MSIWDRFTGNPSDPKAPQNFEAPKKEDTRLADAQALATERDKAWDVSDEGLRGQAVREIDAELAESGVANISDRNAYNEKVDARYEQLYLQQHPLKPVQ